MLRRCGTIFISLCTPKELAFQVNRGARFRGKHLYLLVIHCLQRGNKREGNVSQSTARDVSARTPAPFAGLDAARQLYPI